MACFKVSPPKATAPLTRSLWRRTPKRTIMNFPRSCSSGPIENWPAKFWAKMASRWPGPPSNSAAWGNNHDTAKSDQGGHFHFDGVCAGEVTVSANLDDHWGSVSANGGDTNVVLRMGNYVRNNGQGGVNFAATEKLTGTVRDAAGQPVAGVKVSLFPTSDFSSDGQTDANGRYEIMHHPLTSSALSFWLLARDVRRNLSVLQRMETNATNIDLTLQPGVTLAMQVQDHNGRAVTNATAMISIFAQPNQGNGVKEPSLEMDADGRFRLAGLPQGLGYSVSVTAPGCDNDRVSVAAADTHTNEVALRPCVIDPTDAAVAGQAVGPDGQPVAGVTLTVNSGGPMPKQTVTDAQGRFYFEDVSRGRVRIYIGRVNGNPARIDYTGDVMAWGGDRNVVLHLQSVTRSPAARNGGIRPWCP